LGEKSTRKEKDKPYLRQKLRGRGKERRSFFLEGRGGGAFPTLTRRKKERGEKGRKSIRKLFLQVEGGVREEKENNSCN